MIVGVSGPPRRWRRRVRRALVVAVLAEIFLVPCAALALGANLGPGELIVIAGGAVAIDAVIAARPPRVRS